MRYLISLLILIPLPVHSALVPDNVEEAINTASHIWDLPHNLLKAICTVESNLNPKAVNIIDGGTPSHGLCQLKTKTAKFMGFTGRVAGLYNPYINAFFAARYLRHQLDRYDNDIIKAISAYNRGSAGSTIKNKPYVKKVLSLR